VTDLSPHIKDLKVLLGVSGGVAAYKAVDLASKLTQAGAQVGTVMTQNACQLIMPKSFEAVTRSSVYVDLWQIEEYKIGHISLVDWADIVVLAPATANIIGKMANGICDDLLSTVLCVCSDKPMLMAPAMNSRMWANKAVQRNIQMIKEMAVELIGPCQGKLACGTEGIGRMSQPDEILQAIGNIASKIKK
jgi:phosphopantothenoylcysteine synthetase/decarboxylase